MRFAFTKMQGAGNDFVVINATQAPLKLTSAQIRALCDRRFGIGCDQVLMVESPRRADTEFHYRIFNADGGEVQQCGNGARCFAKYVHDQGLTAKREIRVETVSGVIVPRLEPDGRVTVDMGPPEFEPTRIPFEASAPSVTHLVDVAGRQLEISALSMGNPHAVVIVDDIDTAPVSELGPLIEGHSRFPERVNAGFMQVVSRNEIRLRVYERGSGETLACGTGACAAAVTGIRRGLLDSPVAVRARGGVLEIRWERNGERVFLTGPAETVFEGEIDLPDIKSG